MRLSKLRTRGTHHNTQARMLLLLLLLASMIPTRMSFSVLRVAYGWLRDHKFLMRRERRDRSFSTNPIRREQV
jgi:hypothetical protein